MKKILAAVVVVTMAALGLVASSGGTASAACPYSACIDTTTIVTAKSPTVIGKHGHLKVTVTAAGNVSPTGTITVTVVRIKGGSTTTKTKKYPGHKIRVKTAINTRKGWYKVTVTYNPPANSVFNPSSGTTKFKVKNRKHH